MSQYIYFNCPPNPYFLECGFQIHDLYDTHPNRTNIGIFDIILVKEGCLNIGEENESWELRSGQALILLPDRSHYSVKPAEEYTSFYWLHFQAIGQWLQTEQDHVKLELEEHQRCFFPTQYTLQLLKHTQVSYPLPLFQLFDQLLDANTERESQAYWKKQSLFEQLLKALDVRQRSQDTPPLVRLAEQVENYIRNHYQEDLSNERLSLTFNYHYNYITRALKHIYGYTPNEYIMKVRIDHAKSLLLNTHLNISVIAEKVGFENIPYFTNCFTKHTGFSPSNYRKQYFE